MTRSDTNRNGQPLGMKRMDDGLKFQIEEVEELYFLCRKNGDSRGRVGKVAEFQRS